MDLDTEKEHLMATMEAEWMAYEKQGHYERLVLKGGQDPWDRVNKGYIPEACILPIRRTPFIYYCREREVKIEGQSCRLFPPVMKRRILEWPEHGGNSPAGPWRCLARELYEALYQMDKAFPFAYRHYVMTEIDTKAFIDPLPEELEIVRDLFRKAEETLPGNVSPGWFVEYILHEVKKGPESLFFHPQEAIYRLLQLYEGLVKKLQ